MIEQEVFIELSKRYSQLEQHCISLEMAMQQSKESFQNNSQSINQDVPDFQELFQISDLQAPLKAKDLSIKKLHEHIANLKGKNVVDCA